MAGTPDPKPARRVKNRKLLGELKARYRWCCLCEKKRRDVHLHHVVYKSHSGDDMVANIVSVCQEHHDKIHGRDRATWFAFKRYLERERPDVLSYLSAKLGPGATTFFE